MLQKITVIENVGRFEKALPTQNVRFEKCTLFYGENGWGKSTIADILRSQSRRDPEIIIGRKTLAGGPDQKISLQFDSGRANFERGSWNGTQSRVAVFDSLFVNDNVYSGDTVSADHLRRQYGLVVGEKGVKLVRQIVALDEENTENNKTIRALEAELTAGLRVIGPAAMSLPDFEALDENPDIDKVNDAHDDHPFKGALEDLKDINAYSRVENHAEIDGDPYGDTNPDELRGFCSLVLSLTRGM